MPSDESPTAMINTKAKRDGEVTIGAAKTRVKVLPFGAIHGAAAAGLSASCDFCGKRCVLTKAHLTEAYCGLATCPD